ncbi:MAG TPA: capsular biosynthesis protein [Bacillales bacterium]|nr:capsular biosynthesis protein [Bacillales bacterium]
MQKEINLKVLFDVIKRHIWLIFIITGITAMASGLLSFISEEPSAVYQSSTSILLNSNENDSTSTLEVILRDRTVLSSVITELGLHQTTNKLNEQITFIDQGGKIVKIAVQDTNPELAADIANTTAAIFIKQIGNILGIYDTRIVSEALVSNLPISTKEGGSLVKNIMLGVAAGIVVGIGIVLFLDSLDDSIQSENEIEQLLELQVIGSVSKITKVNVQNKPGERLRKR